VAWGNGGGGEALEGRKEVRERERHVYECLWGVPLWEKNKRNGSTGQSSNIYLFFFDFSVSNPPPYKTHIKVQTLPSSYPKISHITH
jgi:hypothetical protein